MSSIRVIVAVVEGADATVQEALRVVVENFTGVKVAVTPAIEAPPAAAPVAAIAAPVEHAKPGRKPGRKPVANVAPAAEAAMPSAPDAGSGTRQAIVAELRKGPWTSGELIERTGLTSGAVYTELSVMRKAGVVSTRNDPADGRQKNFLVA